MNEKELKFAIKAVKAAKKLGVLSMKLGTLEFTLSPRDEGTRVGRATLKVSAKEKSATAKENQLKLLSDELKDDLSTMHLEDPLGFEQAQIENLIVDDDGGANIEKSEETFVI